MISCADRHSLFSIRCPLPPPPTPAAPAALAASKVEELSLHHCEAEEGLNDLLAGLAARNNASLRCLDVSGASVYASEALDHLETGLSGNTTLQSFRW